MGEVMLQVTTDGNGGIYVEVPDADRRQWVGTYPDGTSEAVVREDVVQAARDLWREVYGN